MQYRFDFDKTAQAVATILRQLPNRRMSYIKLIKILYFADREALQEKGRPISRGPIAAMRHGPVQSTAYDLIKGTYYPLQEQWREFFRTENYDIVMVQDPGVGRLSR